MSNHSLPSESENSKWGALEPHHIQQLEASGISPKVARARGYRSVKSFELFKLGFTKRQAKNGILMPVFSPGETEPKLFILRPDKPRQTATGKVLKYEVPKGTSLRIDCPPLLHSRLKDPTAPLWITEGIKKGDALATTILKEGRPDCVISLLGVWAFKTGTELGGTVVSADLDYIAFKQRLVSIVFDSDLMTKGPVFQALERLTEHLKRKGAIVRWIYLPAPPEGKTGIDDFLAEGHTLAEVEALARLPETEPPLAPPEVKLLPASPAVMKRPLLLYEGTAYLAGRVWVERTFYEELQKGRVVRLKEPRKECDQVWLVIREDGTLFGEGTLHSYSELPFQVALPRDPGPISCFDATGFQKFRELIGCGGVSLFEKVAECFDAFLDFGWSLAPQPVMVDLLAAWVFATYLTPELTFVPYLWITGERGAGKTKLLELIARLACGGPGAVLTPHTTVACLRELSSFGAVLPIDEAHRFVSGRNVDPEKRALALAGNRRGAKVALREPQNRRDWKTTWVEVWAPRVFASQDPPDATLASRCLIIPLVPTGDRNRAGRMPGHKAAWPHPPEELTRALWVWALRNLSRVAEVERSVAQSSALVGRVAEPWIPVLCAAELISPGLRERLEKLARNYQREESLASRDLVALVVQALSKLDEERKSDTSDTSDAGDTSLGVYEVSTREVTAKVKELLEAEGEEPNWVSNDKVGRCLASLRLIPKRISKARRWAYNQDLLNRLKMTYFPSSCSSPLTGPLSVIASLASPTSPPPSTHRQSSVISVTVSQTGMDSVKQPSGLVEGHSVIVSQKGVDPNAPTTWPMCQGCRYLVWTVDICGLCPNCAAVFPRLVVPFTDISGKKPGQITMTFFPVEEEAVQALLKG